MGSRQARKRAAWRLAGCGAALLCVAGCASGPSPALLAGLPDDLAAAPRPDDAPLRRVVASYDGFYAGTVAPAEGAPACPGPAKPVPRTMLVVDGSASFGVNLPFRGAVDAGGGLDMPYLDLGRVTGRFGTGAFRGELRAGPGGRCHWTVRLVRTALPSPADPAPDTQNPEASLTSP